MANVELSSREIVYGRTPARLELDMSKVSKPDGQDLETRAPYSVLPRSVYDDQRLSDAAVRVFCVLDGRITVKSSQRLKHETIADQLGWSVSKVRRALRELVAAGHVTQKHTGRSSFYAVVNPCRESRRSTRDAHGTARDGGSKLRERSDLTTQDPRAVGSEHSVWSDLNTPQIITSLENTSMTAAQPREARQAQPIITATQTAAGPAAENGRRAPEIMPAADLGQYLTEIHRETGIHVDLNKLTEPNLRRIHAHGIAPQELAKMAAAQLAAADVRIKNPAGFLAKTILQSIADNRLNPLPQAEKPTPTPPQLIDQITAKRCDHGEVLGRCALCRQQNELEELAAVLNAPIQPTEAELSRPPRASVMIGKAV